MADNKFLDVDLEDDILDDDDDFVEEEQGSPASLDEISQAARPRHPGEIVKDDIPEGAVRTDFGYRVMPLEDAISEHHPEGIATALKSGQALAPDADPIMMVAKGICPSDLDDQYHQSAKSVAGALNALKKGGLDLNKDHEGVPAAHRVAAYYGSQMIHNHFDGSQKAEYGLTDQDQASRLAEFARAGVDFGAVDDKGRRPLAMMKDMAMKAAADRSVAAKPVVDAIDHQYQQVKSAERAFRVNNSAALEVKRQEEKRAARTERAGPSIDD
jgi:hypothetical protein